MIKRKKSTFLVFILTVFIGAILIGCILFLSACKGQYDVETCVFSKGNIHIEYPQIKGHCVNKDKINDMIKEYATNNSYVSDFLESGKSSESNSYIDFTCEVTLFDEDRFSMVMLGNFNVSAAAHPINIFRTLNIEPKSCSIVKFSDLYDVERVAPEVDKCAKEQLSKPIYDYIISCGGISYFLNEIDSSDENLCSSASREDSLIISFMIPHALGDHAEISVPVNVLT